MKLCWSLGQSDDREEVKRLMLTPVADETTTREPYNGYLVYQGGLTLGAGVIEGLLSEEMVTEMTASGGLMVLGIGVVILDISRPRVANFLPALVIAPLVVAAVARLS